MQIMLLLSPMVIPSLQSNIHRLNCVIRRLVRNILNIVRNIIVRLVPVIVCGLNCRKFVLRSCRYSSSFTLSVSSCGRVQSGSSFIFKSVRFPRGSLEVKNRSSGSDVRDRSILNVPIIVRSSEHIAVPLPCRIQVI